MISSAININRLILLKIINNFNFGKKCTVCREYRPLHTRKKKRSALYVATTRRSYVQYWVFMFRRFKRMYFHMCKVRYILLTFFYDLKEGNNLYWFSHALYEINHLVGMNTDFRITNILYIHVLINKESLPLPVDKRQRFLTYQWKLGWKVPEFIHM